jgi:ABC-type Fe3+-citrate transport system substrate-binding protein
VSEQVERHLLEEIAELKEKIARLEREKKVEDENHQIKPSYSFSSITEKRLKELLSVKRVLKLGSKFDSWLNNAIQLTESEQSFLSTLLEKRENRGL